MYLKKEWKFIKDYEGLYKLSNYGKIKSLERKIKSNYKNKYRIIKERILKGNIDKGGYRHINLWKNDKGKGYKMSLLVWDHFGNKPRNGRLLQVDHIDNNKQNDRIDNLQLLTQRENISKGWRNKKISSRFTGVSWKKKKKRWIVRIQINKQPKHLGSFINEFKANSVYQKALKNIKGEF